MESLKYSILVAGFFVAACSGGAIVDEGVVVRSEQFLAEQCLTTDAVKWRFLANFAVAVGQELGAYNTTEQFVIVTEGEVSKVVLSAYGEDLCASRNGCPLIRGFLALQGLPQNISMVGSSYVLDIQDYRETLVNQLNLAKVSIEERIFEGAFEELPESHGVTYLGNFGSSTCEGPLSHFLVYREYEFVYSSNGEIADRFCIKLDEPLDSQSWSDNYLCTPRDIGLRWSSTGPIDGMVCTAVTEPEDADGWDDNYLCAPEDFGLTFSSQGRPTEQGTQCVAISEPQESKFWDDNFLCWNNEADVNHPSSLELEFSMFGGVGNPYLEFKLESASVFSIDPTDYTSGSGNAGSTGSCVLELPYTSTDPSVAGVCCFVSSSSTYGVLAKYPTRSDLYYCKTD